MRGNLKSLGKGNYVGLIKVLENYQHGRVDAITTIRDITRAISRDYAVETLAVVNLITKIEQGDESRSMITRLIGGISVWK